MRNFKRLESGKSIRRSNSDFDNQNISSSKPISLNEEFEQWLKILNFSMAKCLYKSVFKDVTSNIKKYTSLPIHWKAISLKLKAMIKIINKKRKKYNLSNTFDQNVRFELNRISQYSITILNDISYLINIITQSLNNDLNLPIHFDIVEDIIKHFLDFLVQKSILYGSIGKIAQSISFLFLCTGLIKNSINYIINPDTLGIIEKCYLLLSNLFIQNCDFEKALKFTNDSLYYSFRELFFRLDFLSSINSPNFSKKKKRIINKIILNISIGYYYRGVCFENLTDIKKAAENYKQCFYFSKKFMENNKNLQLLKFFKKILNRILIYNNSISFIIEEDEKMKLHTKLKSRGRNNVKKTKRYHSEQFKDFSISLEEKKFEKSKKKIEQIKIPEIDMVDKFKKNQRETTSTSKVKANDYILSNIRLLHAYLNENGFKKFIKSLDKITICDFDYQTKEKIQKLVNKMYYDHSMRHLESKNSFQNNEHTLRLLNSPSKKTISRCQSQLSNNLVSSTLPNVKFSGSDFSRNKSYGKIRFNPNKVEKYNITQDIFVESYQKKRQFIDNLAERELKFQKQLLQLKTKEHFIEVDPCDNETSAKEAKLLYNRLLMLVNSENKKFDLHKKLTTNQIGELRKEARVRNSVVLSQNDKALRIQQFEEEKNNNEKVIYCDDEDICGMLSDRGEIKKRNQEMLDKLNYKLNLISTKEKNEKSMKTSRNNLSKQKNKKRPKSVAIL